VIVVDCNVLAHLLLEADQTPRARALLQHDADWHAEALILMEFTNVLATAMRARGMAMKDATVALTQAQSVVEPGLHAARDLGQKLVTEDAKLRAAAPRLTQSLATAVGY
jgi:predicted nucleic acid-binding protein